MGVTSPENPWATKEPDAARRRRARGVLALTLVLAGSFLGCGDGGSASEAGPLGDGGAGWAGPGGAGAATGGFAPATGGASTAAAGTGGALGGGAAVGGAAASGGTAAGGTTGGGGFDASGGADTVGGSAGLGGGASVGGSGPIGGTSTGGAGEGGLATTGGMAPVGGGPIESSGGAAGAAGASAGGAASGGSEHTGGGPAGGSGQTGGTAAGGADPGEVPPGLTKLGEEPIALSGLTVVSYGGYLNGESFQQDGITSFNGYQYTAFWNQNRNVVLARRRLPNAVGDAPGPWEKFDFLDYSLSADDAHNTISLGVSPGDGTLHVAFDHHDSDLHYRRSVPGLLADPAAATWSAESFSGVANALVGSEGVRPVTYPRFVTVPGGSRMLFSARIGASGSGDEVLWEYASATQTWTLVGEYIEGTDASINAYLHGLAYTRGGSRLHAAWCWRETPDATTNHDLVYVYSDDDGRTWRDNAGVVVGTAGQTFITRDTPGVTVWPIGQNRGLINQEHLAVDAAGRVHVLLSHLPDHQADDASFTSARTKSEFFDYVRELDGTWSRHAIGQPVIANFRGKLAISSTNNVYAILPDLRLAAASPGDGFTSWTLLDASDAGRFFSDPLIDTARLETSDELTLYYPEAESVNIWGLDYRLE